MSVTILFQPHPGPQTTFMQLETYYALFAGAAGPGKTECLRWDPWRQIAEDVERIEHGEIKFSVGRSILFRRTYPELRELIDRCDRDFRSIDSGANWNQNDKTWTMSCGYRYMFGAMEDENDWHKYYSFEFSWIGFDELTTFTEMQFDQLDTRLRSKDPVRHAKRCIRAATNPVGAGLEWVRRRFVEIAPAGTPLIVRIPVVITNPDGTKTKVVEERSQIYIPAKLSDNPTIDQASYAATLTNKSSSTKRQLLDGDWYVSQGSCFGDLWDQTVHVCKPFKIPSGWYRFRSGDYGFSWPGMSSIQWWAVDTDGNFTCYRSMTVTGLNSFDLGQAIRNVEMEAGEWDMQRDCSKLSGPLDYSCWGETGHTGPTIAEGMINQGVFWEKCDKSREMAAEQIRIRLSRRTGHPTLMDKNGKPMMIVPGIRWFDTCWNIVRRTGGTKVKVGPIITIPVLPADETRPDCWDTKANDHDADACGYACLSRPLIPDNDNAKPDVDEDDELAERRRRNQPSGSAWASGGYF